MTVAQMIGPAIGLFIIAVVLWNIRRRSESRDGSNNSDGVENGPGLGSGFEFGGDGD